MSIMVRKQEDINYEYLCGQIDFIKKISKDKNFDISYVLQLVRIKEISETNRVLQDIRDNLDLITEVIETQH
jgi:hypothetical protein